MCGILFYLGKNQESLKEKDNFKEWQELKNKISSRGPDLTSTENFDISITNDLNQSNKYNISFYDSVLHIRGIEITKQPCIDKNGNVLCWNGEIYDGINVPDNESDTLILSNRLSEISCDDNEILMKKKLLNVFEIIQGEWAFIYYQKNQNLLWFGRDYLGRRSLLWHKPSNINDDFIITSVGQLNNINDNIDSNDKDNSNSKNENTDIKKRDDKTKLNESEEVISTYWEEIQADGIYCLNLNKLSVDNFDSNITKYKWAVDEINELHLKAPFSLINTYIPQENELSELDTSTNLPLINKPTQKAIDQLEIVLGEAVKKRMTNIFGESCTESSKVGLLFSGGLDCMCLAALADRYVPKHEPIDLLNVSFENPRVKNVNQKRKEQQINNNKKKRKIDHINQENNMEKDIYDVPDRITGRRGVEELRKICPERKWNFVEINIEYSETLKYRRHIMDLICPLTTLMDFSIAMSFWFASRGKGFIINENGEKIDYQSKAKILLSGLGADEQLCGYGRHRTHFKHESWKGLIEETQLDISRISTRNLGRDDRIISDHGREVRFPYLDEKVMIYLCQLPIHLKADLRYPKGVGEKLLLRHLARKLKLENSSKEPKRAVQFGARAAKMELGCGKTKGTEKLKY
ncbi:hypothetical protein H8356DRAFT_1682263 [Neocallimastix lanati (nom. inval.)]|jgi:asparagine synthetase B (glutamine-hydrolysing)|uniref:Glutamine amidotransferase type-2 domain-containing protein n=1 Tax=Neocallimastix californiae TaxID=1754190 RepID=A0A1Y2F4T3_9FUNG|nr:hypothetical protein H8356DRAFT_1682263 [Neocallimastix sp. JGI-2020a]ORY78346.1 hypothetical protein LY90DRAFT_376853 [Neocallimastix californiae]|eukprot:ORY78346.1 hypothetical protein LY90DRAFT_376853 [Neocallimastix californiae]